MQGLDANLASINSMLEQDTSAPGGSLRISAAGGNTVSMHETFPRPLVIGYLGFDVAILPGGVLGAPVPSRVTLGDPDAARALFARNRVAAIEARTATLSGIAFLRTAVATGDLAPDLERSGRAVLEDLDALARLVDPDMVVFEIDVLSPSRRVLRCTYAQLTDTASLEEGLDATERGDAPDAETASSGEADDRDADGSEETADDTEPQPGYDAFNAYRVTLASSIDAIDWALVDGLTAIDDRAVRALGAVSRGADTWQERLAQDRARLVAALAELEGPSAERRAVADARAWLALFWSQETR
jgi:hypothetical protein